jgi:hypothetical protein
VQRPPSSTGQPPGRTEGHTVAAVAAKTPVHWKRQGTPANHAYPDNGHAVPPHSSHRRDAPPAVNPAAGSGPVLLIHPDRGAAAEIARALAATGWLAATPGTHGHRRPAAVIVEASGPDAGTAARISMVRKSMPGAPLLFLTTREILLDLLDADTLPGDDYLLAPFTPEDVALRLRWLTRNGDLEP